MSTVAAELRQLDDNQLSELWRAGRIDLDQLTAECDRRDDARRAAERAAAKRAAERAAWLDAAHAQYQQASADCAGRLLADGASLADELSLWRGSESWARRMASEELLNWWDDHGGRLSLARWRSQQAMQRRAARDERDLAAMPAAPERPAPRPAAPPRQQRAPGPIARYITALGALRRQADTTARSLARVSGGIPR